MCSAMERAFRRATGTLDEVVAFVDEFVAAHGVGPSVAYALHLATEEVFTNMVKYNAESPAAIRIRMEAHADAVVATITDEDADPFDPTTYAPARVDRPLRDRKPGGLGIHLLHRMVDEVTYDYQNRRSQIRLTKRLTDPHA